METNVLKSINLYNTNMNKFVKEAMDLYPKLNTVIRHLIDSELDYKDSVTIVEAQQLAKRIMESDGDIVSLHEVWRGNDVKPGIGKNIIVKDLGDKVSCGYYGCVVGGHKTGVLQNNRLMLDWDAVVKWAYVDDIMPKGGEE